ncbi:MAG: hypothetical protein WCL32_15120 [Planctomycetota bacterium]
MQVTPRITPEGRVLMRVIPEISSIANQNYPLGNGLVSTSLNIQHLETTISAYDGETVMLGGLISMRDEKNENKVPWLGDVPYLGSMFRYRSQYKTKTELLIIMTPHIVRNKADGERVLADEARKMDWVLGSVLKVQGAHSLDLPATSNMNVPAGAPVPPQSFIEEGPLPRVMPNANPAAPKAVAPMPPATSANTPLQAPPVINQPANTVVPMPFPSQVPSGVPVNRLTPSSAVVPGEPLPSSRGNTVSATPIPNFFRGDPPVTQLIPNQTSSSEGSR